MTGGKTNNSTNSGASRTVGSPGMSASATPAATSNMAGGTSSRLASSEIAAITARSEIRISMVGSMRCSGLVALQPHQPPPIALVGTRIRARPRHLRQPLLLAKLGAPLRARRSLEIVRLRLGRRTAAQRQTEHFEFSHDSLQREAQAIADAHTMRRLDPLGVQMHFPAADRGRRQAPRLEKAGMP